MESQNVPSVQCSWEFSKGTTTEDVKAVDLGNSSVSTDRITFIIQSSPHTNVYVSFALSALENLHFPVLSCKTCDVITLPMSLYCWQNAQLFIAKLLRRWSQASSYFCLHSYCFLSRGLSCTLAHKKKKKKLCEIETRLNFRNSKKNSFWFRWSNSMSSIPANANYDFNEMFRRILAELLIHLETGVLGFDFNSSPSLLQGS